MNASSTETPTLNPTQALGQIAVELPGSTAVFRRLKLDFCCGGQVSLETAVAEKGLNLQDVLDELAPLHRSGAPTTITEPAALIDHIIERYHEVHRAQLPELVRMARRVEAVHRDNPNVPAGLADLLEVVESELLMHMQKEENILFPMMKSGHVAAVAGPVHVMRAEHAEAGAELEKIAELTHDATPPAEACNTWRALYSGIAQFSDDLMHHIHLENNVLFPQFQA